VPYKTPYWGRNAGKLIRVKSNPRPKGLRRYSPARDEQEAQTRAFWEQHAGYRGRSDERVAPPEARVLARSDPRSRRPG